MSALERIRKKQNRSIIAEENTNAMFWIMTMVAFVPFLAVGVWKFFFFQQYIDIPHDYLEKFLEVSAAGISEAFRFGSLIMAFYEAKKGRIVSVWFGIILSISIMLYDVQIGMKFATRATLETYIFFCVIGEVIGIRAIFGSAFEEGIAVFLDNLKRFKLERLLFQSEAETNDSETETLKQPETVSKPETLKQKKPLKQKKTKPVSETIQVNGFKNPLSESQIRSKLKQYTWKRDNGKGKTETNQKNIDKLKQAYVNLTGEMLV